MSCCATAGVIQANVVTTRCLGAVGSANRAAYPEDDAEINAKRRARAILSPPIRPSAAPQA